MAAGATAQRRRVAWRENAVAARDQFADSSVFEQPDAQYLQAVEQWRGESIIAPDFADFVARREQQAQTPEHAAQAFEEAVR